MQVLQMYKIILATLLGNLLKYRYYAQFTKSFGYFADWVRLRLFVGESIYVEQRFAFYH